jgi:hypothetical protein
MADTKSAGPSCPICSLPVGDSKFVCHLCRANGQVVRFDSGPCEAEHLSKAHTQEEIENFDAAQTIKVRVDDL